MSKIINQPLKNNLMPLNCNFNGPLPAMHFPEALSKQRNQWFLDHQYQALNTSTVPAGQTENVYFYFLNQTLVNFLTTYVLKAGVTYLRIYFADINNELDLIYATNDPLNPMTNELYFRFIENPDPTKSQFVSIPKGAPGQAGTAADWANQFVIHKLPTIASSSGISNPTKSILYSQQNISLLVTEIVNQAPTGIKAYLSSYTATDPDTDQGLSRHDRMFVNFVFTSINSKTGLEEDAYIDDCPNFPKRKSITAMLSLLEENADVTSLSTIFDFDNGTMCPPDNNCSKYVPSLD
jgi:hypothetical protein